MEAAFGTHFILIPYVEHTLFSMIYFTDYFPVVTIFNKSEHIGVFSFSELRVDSHHSYILGNFAIYDFV